MKTETLVFLGIIAYLYFNKSAAAATAPGAGGSSTSYTPVSSSAANNEYCLDQNGNPYFVGSGPCPILNVPTVGNPNPIPTGLQAV